MPAKQKKSSKLTRVSKKAKSTKPHFKIWVGVLVVLIIAVVGMVVVRFSQASSGSVWFDPANKRTTVPLRANSNNSMMRIDPYLPLVEAPFATSSMKFNADYNLYQRIQRSQTVNFIIGDGNPGTNSATYANNLRTAKRVCLWGISIGYTDLSMSVVSFDPSYSGGTAIASHPPYQDNNGVAKTPDGKARNDIELICTSTPAATFPNSHKQSVGGTYSQHGRNNRVVVTNNTRNGSGYVFITNMVFYY